MSGFKKIFSPKFSQLTRHLSPISRINRSLQLPISYNINICNVCGKLVILETKTYRSDRVDSHKYPFNQKPAQCAHSFYTKTFLFQPIRVGIEIFLLTSTRPRIFSVKIHFLLVINNDLSLICKLSLILIQQILPHQHSLLDRLQVRG